MQTKAVLRYARISPQKCRLVVDTIRGKSATLAVNTLKFMPKKPLNAVTGRKINETSVSRLICSACRCATAIALSCMISDSQRRRS